MIFARTPHSGHLQRTGDSRSSPWKRQNPRIPSFREKPGCLRRLKTIHVTYFWLRPSLQWNNFRAHQLENSVMRCIRISRWSYPIAVWKGLLIIKNIQIIYKLYEINNVLKPIYQYDHNTYTRTMASFHLPQIHLPKSQGQLQPNFFRLRAQGFAKRGHPFLHFHQIKWCPEKSLAGGWCETPTAQEENVRKPQSNFHQLLLLWTLFEGSTINPHTQVEHFKVVPSSKMAEIQVVNCIDWH